jgi:hypothetical protein
VRLSVVSTRKKKKSSINNAPLLAQQQQQQQRTSRLALDVVELHSAVIYVRNYRSLLSIGRTKSGVMRSQQLLQHPMQAEAKIVLSLSVCVCNNAPKLTP